MLGFGALGGLILLLIAIGLYFIPSMVAFDRNIPNRNSVLVINLLLGWTLLGWVAALAMAVSGERRKAPGDGESAAQTPRTTQPETPRASSVAELERLADLHRQGALSDEEFQRAKARVLGG